MGRHYGVYPANFQFRIMRWFSIVLVMAGVTVSCRGGCPWVHNREAARDLVPDSGQEARAAVEAWLRIVPAEASIAMFMDVAQIRDTALWKRIAALAEARPEDRKIIEAFASRTGLDPFRQIHRVLAVFPGDARVGGEFALFVHGQGFDQERLLVYARDKAAERGAQIEARSRYSGGRTLWAQQAGGALEGFFLDRRTFVLGGGGWGEKMARAADGMQDAGPGAGRGRGHGRGPEEDAELIRLCRRLDTSQAAWLAAMVPGDVRRALLNASGEDDAASVMRIMVGMNPTRGLAVQLTADLSNAEDAQALAGRIDDTLRAAQRSPTVLKLGLGPTAASVSVRAAGPRVQVSAQLTDEQVASLLDRLAASLRPRREAPTQ
jgi:hypothetical protein